MDHGHSFEFFKLIQVNSQYNHVKMQIGRFIPFISLAV